MLYYAVVFLYVIACFLLITAVLLQQGKGGDIAAAFGGGSSQTAFGARQGATVLTKATTVLGAMFMIGALSLAVLGQKGPTSVLGGLKAPAPAAVPATTPAAPQQAAPTPGTSAPAPAQSAPTSAPAAPSAPQPK